MKKAPDHRNLTVQLVESLRPTCRSGLFISLKAVVLLSLEWRIQKWIPRVRRQPTEWKVFWLPYLRKPKVLDKEPQDLTFSLLCFSIALFQFLSVTQFPSFAMGISDLTVCSGQYLTFFLFLQTSTVKYLFLISIECLELGFSAILKPLGVRNS